MSFLNFYFSYKLILPISNYGTSQKVLKSNGILRLYYGEKNVIFYG